MLFCAR